MSVPVMRGRGERAAVLVLGLAWLVLIAFPVAHVVTAPPVRIVVPALALLGVALLADVHAVWVIARDGPPRSCVPEVVIVATAAVLLPVLFGGAWFGATVFLAVLVGMGSRGSRALVGVGVSTLLAVASGLPSGVAQSQFVSVVLLTAMAGVIVIVVVRQLELSRELSRLAVRQERLRLARDLHDSVKQHAFVAAMELGAARARSADRGAHLDAAAAAVEQVQQRLSGVLDELRPLSVARAPSLHTLVSDWSSRTGLPVELDLSGCGDARVELLLPVAAEALTNIERHAVASCVRITWEDGSLVIRDNGVGFDQELAGHGLTGMRERLATFGGALEVSSGPSGTTVRAGCPR